MIEYVQFFPTLKCNKNCDFCFSRELVFDDFPQEKIKQLIRFLDKNQIKCLDIIGGEPFLYKYLNMLVEKAMERKIEITISTNGTLIEKLKIFLENFQSKKVKVGVSINNQPAQSLLDIIKEYRLWIKSVIKKDKIPEGSLLEFTKNLEIKYYFIYMDALTEKQLNNAITFYEFIENVKKLKNSFPNIEPVFCKGFLGGVNNYRCPAGTEKITLMPDGSVYPCYLLASFKEYRLGNIFKNSLTDILDSKNLDIFKKYNGNMCHNKLCNFHRVCRGGCVAHSIIHYGTHENSDPRCNIKKEG